MGSAGEERAADYLLEEILGAARPVLELLEEPEAKREARSEAWR